MSRGRPFRAKGVAKITLCFSAALVIALTFHGQNTRAQTISGLISEDDTKKVCDQFLGKINGNDLNGAFSLIKPYIGIPEADFKVILDETTEQRAQMIRKFGKSLSVEFIQEQKIKDTLAKYTYLEKCKIHVIRWSFIFYKPEDKWILNSFYWDDNVRDLFR